MKKLLYLSLALMLAATLCACGGDETTGNTTTGSPSETTVDSTTGTTQQPTTGTAEHTHSFGEWKVVAEASCTEKGLKQRVCECGEKETEEIAAKGHTEAIDKAVAATCTKSGLTEGKHCSVCDEILLAQEEIAALGHTEVIDNAVDATCGKSGLTEGKHCSICKEVLVKQEKVTVPHEYKDGFCVNCGAKQPSEGLLYQRNDDGVSFTVVGLGTCTDTDLVIPQTYKDLPVTAIGDSAFEGCYSLTSITIPDSVTSIGKYAFNRCGSLTGVYIIDLAAWCDIDFGNGSANPLCNGAKLYLNSEEVTSVTLPADMTEVKNYLFYGCTSLTSITIPDSVTSIGRSAFYGCNSLNAVYISDLAAWCNIDFSNNPLSYAGNLYINGKLATDIVIPDSVTSIGDSAFEGCSSLTSITIPDSVTRIGYFAFCGCNNLTSITIPNSVTRIGGAAFYDKGSLTDIYYNGTYKEWQAIEKGGKMDGISYDWIYSSNNYTLHCTDGDYSRYE